MRKFSILLLVVALSGCAKFRTSQIQHDTFDANEKLKSRTTSTKVTSSTLWESKSNLSSFKAEQTDAKQGASVGSLSQQADSTNTVKILDAFARLLEAANPK